MHDALTRAQRLRRMVLRALAVVWLVGVVLAAEWVLPGVFRATSIAPTPARVIALFGVVLVGLPVGAALWFAADRDAYAARVREHLREQPSRRVGRLHADDTHARHRRTHP